MSIRSKLTIMFLAIALIPLLLVSTITFTNYKNSLEASRFSQLRDLVTFKTERIEAYLDGLKTDIEIVQNSYPVKKNLPVLTRLANNPVDPEFLTAKKMLDDVLRKTPSVSGLSDIMLVNPEGKVVYSSNPEHYPKDFLKMLPDSPQKAFEEGKNKIYFSDVFLNKAEGDKSGLLITAPAFDLNGAFIGVIALEVDTAYIYRLIQDVTGLGDTGETLVGQKIGNQAVFLNPLRHDPEAALKRKINIGEKVGGPMQEAVQGREGVGQLVDYRGKKVIAAWQYIPSLNWGIVAKIDTQEAFADVVNLRNLVIIILLIIFVLAGIMAFSIAQSISGPINKLSKAAQIISSGNLDYKFETNTKDEIGQLSTVFDKMVQDVKKLGFARDTERQRLYSVLETLPVYVVLLSEDYHVPFANKFFCERFGESGGKRCYEYLFKLSEPCENCETYKVMKTDAPHHWEWLGPDNRNYDIYDYPFVDTDGSRMILEMGIDITEQKRAQESLREASQYARSLLEASLDPLVTISSEGKITDVNDATIGATGLSRQELIGTDFSDYFTEPEKAQVGYKQVFDKGFVTDYPLTIRHKDGRLIEVLYNASVYKDTRGNVLGVFAAARDVTERKHAEAELEKHRHHLEELVEERSAELKESEERLRQALEAGEFGTWGLDIKTNKAWRSLRHDQIFGYESSLPEWTYQMFIEHVLPEDRKAVDEKFGLALAKGGEWNFECRIKRADGAIHWIWAQGKPKLNEQGSTVMLTGLVQDITERKQAEEEIRQNAQRLELLSETASQLLKSKNPQQSINTLCRNVMEHLDCQAFFNFLVEEKTGRLHLNTCAGIPAEEALRIEWLDYGVAVCGCAARDAIRIVAEHIPSTPDVRTELVKSYGIKAYACHPILGPGNKVIGTLSFGTRSRETFSDEDLSLMKAVTDLVAIAMTRIQSEEALRQTRDYLENIFNYANAPIICWDEQFKITRFNHAFEHLTNYKQEEVIGKDLSILFPDDTRKESLEKIQRTVTGEHWEVVEIHIRRKDEETRIVLWNSANVYADDGKTLLATIAQGQDITKRKQTEEELKRSNENLEQFAYVASHDLQEPLRMMASFSELLERRYNDKLDTDANEFIGYIVDGAKRMQRLINDLLTYSRIGRTDMPIGEIDCNSILGRVINSMMVVIEESKTVITHDELPTLAGSESNFIQLFQNLIGNAIKFHGPELPRVHVSTIKEGDEWVFSVKDNGIGIESQYTDRIFLIFQRLHGRDKYPGTGIGLSICKKIVETQGGRIWVKSEYGKGSTFYFTIPAKGGLKNE